MNKVVILILTLLGAVSTANCQTVGDLIGQGRKFEAYGELKTGYYKVMLETELLNAVVVEESGSIYHFSILTSTKRKENQASVTYDINADNKGDKYYLALTISKVKRDCLLLVFDGTKSDWYPEKIAVRSYGFHNF